MPVRLRRVGNKKGRPEGRPFLLQAGGVALLGGVFSRDGR